MPKAGKKSITKGVLEKLPKKQGSKKQASCISEASEAPKVAPVSKGKRGPYKKKSLSQETTSADLDIKQESNVSIKKVYFSKSLGRIVAELSTEAVVPIESLADKGAQIFIDHLIGLINEDLTSFD